MNACGSENRNNMYDILWGESGSRKVRDEEGVEETETRENEEREKREKEEREERERINKYKNMETSEIIKRSKVFQKINKSQCTEEENKELASLLEIYASRLLNRFQGEDLNEKVEIKKRKKENITLLMMLV